MLVEQLTLTPQTLSSIPRQERALIFVMGHAINELNVLNKMFMIASNFPEKPRILVHAHICQALTISRALTGKLHEAWMAIQNGYLKNKLAITYNPDLEQEVAEALTNLKQYFGKKNLIEIIRNTFAFHYSLSHATVEIPAGTPEEDLCIYFGNINANTLYQFAEQAMGNALLDSINSLDHGAAFNQLISETSKVVSWINLVGQGLMFVILERHAKISARIHELKEIEIGDAPAPENIHIPFFIDYPAR